MTELNVAQYIIIIIGLLVFVWMVIDMYAPNYRNYLIGIWQFYFLKKYENPLHYKLYTDLEKQLKQLEKEGARKYEQNLVRLILDEAGKYKAKMTGKNKNKIRYKINRQGKKHSNFKN